MRCIHFRVDGPVVADMQAMFATDWDFTTGERLEGEQWFAPVIDRGTVAVRGIPDGPDADIDNLPRLLLGAISVATRCVRVVTPFFLPDEGLASALVDGAVQWTVQLAGDKTWAGPVLAGGKVWLTSGKGLLVSVDAMSGKLMSQQELGNAVFIPPVIAQRRMCVLPDNAKLIALN